MKKIIKWFSDRRDQHLRTEALRLASTFDGSMGSSEGGECLFLFIKEGIPYNSELREAVWNPRKIYKGSKEGRYGYKETFDHLCDEMAETVKSGD